MRVRIEDVAAAAGVSMKTVSRVLNGEPGVRQETRARIEAAASALDYRPDPAARRLAGRRSYLVGFFYDNPSASYLMELIAGVVEACSGLHYGMLVQPVEFQSRDLVDTVEAQVAASQLDGVILTPPLTDFAPLLRRLQQRGIAYASVTPKDSASAIGVTLDDEAAVCELMQLLIAQGHRRIAHIKGDRMHGACQRRFRGYRRALRGAGLDYDPDLVVQGDFSFDAGVRAARSLLDLARPPTAIFAGNDDMATGVLSVAYERGLRVPAQLSICGYDDMPASRQIYPPLTTIHQPVREMGRVVTAELVRAIRDPAAGRMVPMPYALKLRGSIAPPASADRCGAQPAARETVPRT
ncbi:LacI family DNA-binding transcriptional regulator, partial [Xanthomonas sp. Kuri4-2]